MSRTSPFDTDVPKVCPICGHHVDDALDFFDLVVAGEDYAESLRNNHWHDEVELRQIDPSRF